MRSALIVISFVLIAMNGRSQVWSDSAQYNAYMKGDWKRVLKLGKLAKRSGADYYYIRARNGYANFMLGKYFRSEKEFEKALKFNSADPFSKRYGYWSSVYAGNVESALVTSSKMSQAEKDTFQVMKPKFLSSISALGGYRASTSQNFVGDMPYFALYLGHQFGKRITLRHGVGYLSQRRRTYPARADYNVWQVGYLASIGIQVAKHTTITPSVVLLNWSVKDTSLSGLDVSGALSVKQHLGNFRLSVNGGIYRESGKSSSDTLKYIVSGSLVWYPLGSTKLYTITSGGYNFGGKAPNPFVSQSIGGQLFKRAWVKSTFIWGHQIWMIEDGNMDFSNNSGDRLQWLWSISPTYYVTDHFSMSVTYSVESRSFYVSTSALGAENGRGRSFNYNFHSFYVGLNYNF
ncbi:MAG: hypothetical protein GC178_14640 [Flavobacteriales bacterium]|nr:hypothetical protein [Flavobacteriales bacterium]